MTLVDNRPAHAVYEQALSSEVVVIVPAWNEEATISATVASIRQQTVPVDGIVVVVNNTTDNTAAVAQAAGAEVLIMSSNKHKKAGAINYALTALRHLFSDHTFVLVMDADTTLDSRFVEAALGEMEQNPRAGGVSSVFEGRTSDTILGAMQQMEYFRYQRDIRRNGNRAFVLSGTASLIRWVALSEIKQARQKGNVLPRGESYYDVHSLTEDNELTFALLTLDWDCPAPGVTSTTDVMESLTDLQRQRRRWYLGALGNLWQYGTKMPWHLRWIYWRQQIGLALSIMTCAVVLVALVLNTLLGSGGMSWPFVLLLGLHLFERIVTVWAMGWRYRLIALAYIPELLYALVLLGIYILAASDHVRGQKGSWHAT